MPILYENLKPRKYQIRQLTLSETQLLFSRNHRRVHRVCNSLSRII